MKKFSFRLQGVLNVKQQLEEQAKGEFGAARAKLIAEEEKLAVIINRLDDEALQMRGLVSHSLNVQKIKHCREAMETLKEKRTEQEQNVNNAALRAELARKKLNAAMLERKTLEKLRERAWDDYLKEFNADEQKQIDMLVSYNYSAG